MMFISNSLNKWRHDVNHLGAPGVTSYIELTDFRALSCLAHSVDK